MKTLRKAESQNKDRYFVPKSVQDVIPIQTIWEDGIFMLGTGKRKQGVVSRIISGALRSVGIKNDTAASCFSKTFRFEDVNYSVASKDDQEAMFKEYSELLNSFDSDATYKITIVVKKPDKDEFRKSILIPLKGDELDVYRAEYNKILLEEATGSNGFVQQKYITVGVYKKSIEEARNFFSRTVTDLTAHFNRLGSRAIILDANDRLRILHDFFRSGEDIGYEWSAADSARKGHSFKDYICPDTFEFEKDHFRMGDKFGRVVFLRDYANFIKDDLVSKLCDFNCNMMLSIDVMPIPTDEAVREIERVSFPK